MNRVLFIVVAIFFLLGITSGAVAQSPAQPVAAVVAPVPAVAPAAPSPAVEAPPSWLVSALETVYAVPVIGPAVAKGVQWLGVLSIILTSLVVFLLTSVRALLGVANLAGLIGFAAWLENFQAGKLMYYLKYLSMFNAQKEGPKV